MNPLPRKILQFLLRAACLAGMVVVVAGMGTSRPASAETQSYVIRSEGSYVELLPGSTLSFGDGSLVSLSLASIGPQDPTGRVRAELAGMLVATLKPDASCEAGMQLMIVSRRTSARLVASGSWLPGRSGNEASPDAAQLAVAVSVSRLDVTAAVRDLEVAFGHPHLPVCLAHHGDGRFEFDLASSDLAPRPMAGVIDYEAARISWIAGSAEVGSAEIVQYTDSINTAVVAEQESGARRIEIPIGGSLVFEDRDFLLGLPWVARLEFEGKIVATTRTWVPEPGPTPLAGAAVLTLALLARARRQRR